MSRSFGLRQQGGPHSHLRRGLNHDAAKFGILQLPPQTRRENRGHNNQYHYQNNSRITPRGLLMFSLFRNRQIPQLRKLGLNSRRCASREYLNSFFLGNWLRQGRSKVCAGGNGLPARNRLCLNRGCGHRRGQFRLSRLRRLGEAIFIFRFERPDDQLSQQFEAANVTIVETERFRRESFQQSDNAPAAAQGNRDHGTRAQMAASLPVDAIVGFGIVAANDLRSAETCSGKGRIALDSCPDVRLDRASGGAQNDFLVFRECDS